MGDITKSLFMIMRYEENDYNMAKKVTKSKPSSTRNKKYTAVQGYTKSDGTRVRPHLRRVKK